MVNNQLINNYNYIKTSGQQCPVCELYKVTALDHVETENGSAWQKIQCNSCKSTWLDTYKLTGYDNLIDRRSNKGV